MPEAGEPPQATEGKPERKVVVQPPPRAVKPTDLKKAAGKEDAPESEPWKVTPKLGVEGGTSRQLRTGRRENAQSAVVGVEFDKEGAGSLGAELKGEHAKETVPGKEPESSFSLELAVDGKIPVGSWIFNPEKIKPWVFFKEIGLQGSLATKRSPGPDAETLRTLAGELTVDLIGLELRSKKLDLGLGLSTIMKMEGMKGADGPKWSYELGGKVGADAKVRPTGGTFFIFVEGSAKLTTTKEKGGSFQPGIFAFTLLGGVGWEFPISRKRASRR
jgi:hypothetical protein